MRDIFVGYSFKIIDGESYKYNYLKSLGKYHQQLS